MPTAREQSTPHDEDLLDSLSYLSRRVRQEAEAAICASSIASTSLHVILATAYAKRLGESSASCATSTAEDWIDKHRVW
jgi:hypothetical protein